MAPEGHTPHGRRSPPRGPQPPDEERLQHSPVVQTGIHHPLRSMGQPSPHGDSSDGPGNIPHHRDQCPLHNREPRGTNGPRGPGRNKGGRPDSQNREVHLPRPPENQGEHEHRNPKRETHDHPPHKRRDGCTHKSKTRPLDWENRHWNQPGETQSHRTTP